MKLIKKFETDNKTYFEVSKEANNVTRVYDLEGTMFTFERKTYRVVNSSESRYSWKNTDIGTIEVIEITDDIRAELVLYQKYQEFRDFREIHCLYSKNFSNALKEPVLAAIKQHAESQAKDFACWLQQKPYGTEEELNVLWDEFQKYMSEEMKPLDDSSIYQNKPRKF